MNKLAIIGIAIGLALSSKASFTLSPGSSAPVVVGSSAEQIAYFTVNLASDTSMELASAHGSFGTYVYDNSGVAASAPAPFFDIADSSVGLSSLSASSFHTVLAGTYTLAVAWYLDPSVAIGTYAGNTSTKGVIVGLQDQSLAGQTTSLYDTVNVTSVPEPAQAIAGAMILGCGGLIFVGRRMVKKQVA